MVCHIIATAFVVLGLAQTLQATPELKAQVSENIKNIDIESIYSHVRSQIEHKVNSNPESFERRPVMDTTSTTATCSTFSFTSPMEALASTCYNAVDYSFYVPAGVSLAFLETTARDILGNEMLSVLPNSCLVSLKKLVCSRIYLKCPSNIDLTDLSTYNYNIYSDLGIAVPMPFQRPCQSLCVNVNDQCLGLLGLMGFSQDCNAKYDYSFGQIPSLPYQYDSTNNTNKCNGMTASFQIGKPQEPYIGGPTGACGGIVDQLYVPPSSAISSVLAPLQSPYVIQTILETALADNFKVLPPWLSKDCNFAMKKYLCRSVMIRSGSETYLDAFTNAGVAPYLGALSSVGINTASLLVESVYMPSYPSRDICETYESYCAGFITLANIPALVPNCSKTTTLNGITMENYPRNKQTILSFPVTVGSLSLSIPFQTSPDDVSYATTSYETSCPNGFVVPDDPTDSRVSWIPGTGCAPACRLPILTDEEISSLNTMVKVLGIVGLITSIMIVIIWSFDKTRSKQHFVQWFGIIGLIGSITIIITISQPYDSVCANNAVPLDNTDGPNHVCAWTSFVFSYCVFGTVIAWTLQCLDVHLKICWGMKTDNYKNKYMGLTFLGPFIPIIAMASLGTWGFVGGPQVCVLSVKTINKNLDLPILIFPLMLAISISIVLMGSVIYQILAVTGRTAGMAKLQKRASQVKVSVAPKPSTLANHFVAIDNAASSAQTSSRNVDDKDVEAAPVADTQKSVQAFKVSISTNKVQPMSGDAVKSTISNDKLSTKSTDSKNGSGYVISKVLSYLPRIPADQLATVRTPTIFFVIFLGLWVDTILFRSYVYGYKHHYEDSFVDWAMCAFLNFDGTNGWTKVCGDAPAYRMSYSMNVAYYFCVVGGSLTIGVVYLSNISVLKLIYRNVAIAVVYVFSCGTAKYDQGPKNMTKAKTNNRSSVK